jgi:general secretion pathway protein G
VLLIGLAIAQWASFVVVLLFGVRMAYRQHVRTLLHTQETILRQDLFVMREAIDQFTMDQNAAPKTLDDLRRTGYLKEIPRDPFTHSANWAPETCDTLMSPDQTKTGICDVHSVAPGSSPYEGTPYISW